MTIWKGKEHLLANLDLVKEGDIYIGPATQKALPPAVLAYLAHTGVRIMPNMLAQQLSASKCAQAIILKKFMIPLTMPIFRRHDILSAMIHFQSGGIREVVTKNEGMHCGHGVRRWRSLDDAYNQLGFETPFTPIVIQPFVKTFVDARLIFVGEELLSAYMRENVGGFRKNLAVGGNSQPFRPKEDLIAFCQDVMKKAAFPFAHLDVMILPNGAMYLQEIALHGGVKGASITTPELDTRKEEYLNKLVSI